MVAQAQKPHSVINGSDLNYISIKDGKFYNQISQKKMVKQKNTPNYLEIIAHNFTRWNIFMV